MEKKEIIKYENEQIEQMGKGIVNGCFGCINIILFIFLISVSPFFIFIYFFIGLIIIILNIIKKTEICIACNKNFSYSEWDKMSKKKIICAECIKTEEKEQKKRQKEISKSIQIEKDKKSQFNFIYPRSKQILDESVDIINKTKNIETAITRFDTIKGVLEKLFDTVPKSKYFSFTIGDEVLKNNNELEKIEEIKQKWIYNHLKDKIELELKKADAITSPKLKINQLKKALNTTLKAFEYIPDSENLKEMVTKIENKINSVSS